MIWNLSCRKTRRLLALSVGNDLDERELPGAQRHLAVCPCCREVWQNLRQSQQVIEQVCAAPVADQGSPASVWPSPSIWPAVARHVRAIDEQVAAPNWRGWLPAGALAAACLAVVMVALPDSPSGTRTSSHRDPQVIFPQHFVSESDPSTLRRLPVSIVSDPDHDATQVGDERPPQQLKVRHEPRSF